MHLSPLYNVVRGESAEPHPAVVSNAASSWWKTGHAYRAGRAASGHAQLTGKNAEKMFSCSKIGTAELWRLKLTNGGLNLHTPTISVCRKINEAVDADRQTNREIEIREPETTSELGPVPHLLEPDICWGSMLVCLVYSLARDVCVSAGLMQWNSGSAQPDSERC